MIAKTRRLSGSLLTRILVVEALTIIAACLVLPLLARSELTSSVTRIENDVLLGQAETVARGLGHAPGTAPGAGWHVDLGEALRPIYATGYDGRAYAVVDAQQHLLAASRFALPSLWPQMPYSAHMQRFETGTLVGLRLPVSVDGTKLWVVVTQDQTRPGAVVDDVVHAFLPRYLVGLVGLLLLMPLINGIILWHSFQKLRRVAHEAAAIRPQALHARLEESGLPTEARALVRATNGLLERVQAAFHLQEEFAGNVAHELRTPLAALRVQIGLVEDGPVRETMIRQIERMSHVLSQLRDLASLESAGHAEMAPLDLSELVIALVVEMTPEILQQGRGIAVVGAEQPILVLGNRVQLTIALRNLIDNARKHTPGGHHIEVSLGAEGSVHVADDGPGIAEDDSPHLVRRLWRADQQRSDGAGLGLSIVQRIVDSHHGRLEIGRSAMGGAMFSLLLRPAPKP